MTKYIQHVADNLLLKLDKPVFYYQDNPLDFMLALQIDNKANFFKRHIAEYSLSSAAHDQSTGRTGIKNVFKLDEDF